MGNQRGLKGARRFLVCQLGVTMLLASFAILLLGTTAAISAILGGTVSIVPNAFFARQSFRYHGAHAAKQIVNSFYLGEAVKIVLSITLFIVVFKFFKIVPLIFFAVYVVVQMVFWLAPLIFDNNRNRPESD